jgi:hypothetical protein
MKAIIIGVSFLLFCFYAHAQVGINENGNPPASGAMLDVSSTSMGFLPPRMTTQQRDAIPDPPEGLTIYNTSIKCLEYYRGVSAGWYSACPTIPIVSTAAVTSIAGVTAVSGGAVANDGGATVTARGVCWSVNSSPTTGDSFTTDGIGIGGFVSNLSGLAMGTLYYLRAYATNNVGTAYGNEISFTTLDLPTVSTSAVSAITFQSASGGGDVSDDGGAVVSARGICWSQSPSPTILDEFASGGSGNGAFACNLSGLSTGTTYYVRAYATNEVGTVYGNEVSFTTKVLLYFTNTGSTTWTVPEGLTSVALTVVGGGGDGGGDVGGGGGGGQVINEPSYAVSGGQILTIDVAGQTDFTQTYSYYGRDGQASSVSGGTGGTITAMGGNGGRGRSNGGGPGSNVGWNGGGGSYDYSQGNPGQGGYAGGNAYPGKSAGGGGGSGGQGFAATSEGGGVGGSGVQSIIDGIMYGGGGGGGEYQGNFGGAGTDGGGTGGRQGNNPSGTDGLPNRGGGGGGGGSTGNFPNSGRGSSGVVILSY